MLSDDSAFTRAIVTLLDHGDDVLFLVVLPIILQVGNMKLIKRYSSLIGCFPDKGNENCKAYAMIFGHRLIFLAFSIGIIQSLSFAWKVNLHKEHAVSNAAIFLLVLIGFLILFQLVLRFLRWLISKRHKHAIDGSVYWTSTLLNITGTMLLSYGAFSFCQVVSR